MRLLKRTLSAFLAFVMVFTMLPLQVWASQTQQDTSDQPVNFGSMVEPAAGGDTEYDYTIRVGETKTVVRKGLGLTWISSDDGVVKISDAGGYAAKITGIAPGDAKITHKNLFSDSGKTFRVKVLPLVDSLTLDKETMTLTGKQTEAMVDDEGNVTSVGVGKATITATVSGTSALDSCEVTVQEAKLDAIHLAELSLAVGKTGKMPITYTPAEPLVPQLVWSVADGEIAEIAEDGAITAKKIGETTVTVTCGNLTSNAKLAVTEIVPESIKLDRTSVTIQGMEPYWLKATVLPTNADQTVTWTSSNEAAATVDESGKVYPVGLGKTTITATTSNGLKAYCDVTVEALPHGGNTPVYVYLQIKLEDGMQKPDGWDANDHGWYTVGVLYVPASELASAERYNVNNTEDTGKATKYLGQISLWPEDSKFTAAIDLSSLTWTQLLVSNGADDYVDAGTNTWHLDGEYTIKAEESDITVLYKDEYGNTLTPATDPNAGFKDVINGNKIKIEYPQFENYTVSKFDGLPVGAGETSHDLIVVGDRTITITYKGNSNSYTVKYVDEQGKPIPDVENVTVDSRFGATINAQDVLNARKKDIPNFTYSRITPVKDLTIQENPGLNVFTLHYTRDQYTVTYRHTDPLTGKAVTAGPETQGAGLWVTAKAAPTISGYEFSGWKDTAQENKVTIQDGEFIMPDRDVTFTGSFSVPDSQKYAVKATIKLAGRELASETKTDINWERLGQYYEMPPHNLANEFWSLGLTSGENMTATWVPLKAEAAMQYDVTQDSQYHEVTITLPENSTALVTLTYDANDGTGEPDAVTALKNTEVTVSSTEPTRENYTFTGWNTAENGSGTSYPANRKIKLTDDTTLYAQWTANTAEYKVQYLFQKADGHGYEQRSDVVGYTASGNIGDEITPLKLAEDKIPTGFAYENHDTNVEISADGKTVVKVYYDRLEYTITWKYTGAPVEQEDVVKTYAYEAPLNGVTYPNPTDFTAQGYEFTGWDEKALPDTMPAENIVIIGSYAPIDYKVEYVPVGAPDGTTLPQPEGFYHVGKDVELMGEPTIPDGYKFDGWYTNKECTDKATDFKMPAGDVTLYGKFSKRTDLAYTVNYIWNDTVLETVLGTGTFGNEIVPAEKSFDGYRYKGQDVNVTITADESSNVVNVYYYKNVTLTANSDNNRIYNGEPQSLSGYTASVEGLTFEGVEEPTATATNAGEYPLTFADGTKGKTDSTDKYIVTEVTDGKLTIKPKAVTLRTEGASKDYDGEPLTKPGVNGVDGFVAADVEQVEATGTQTLVGKSDNTIEIVWTDDALAKNYTITEDLGTLTVTAPEKFDYVQKTHQEGNYTVGQTVYFTITVTNIYAVDATVQLNEQKDMTITGVDSEGKAEIPAGKTREFDVSYEVTEADVEAGEIKNKVTWTLTPDDKDVPPVEGDDESIIKNESYLVWYVLEGDTEGCTNDMPKQTSYKYGKTVTVWMPKLVEGYKFSGWTVEGAEIVDGVFSMPDNAVILRGTISKDQVKVDYKAQEGGLITDSNGLSYADLTEMVPYGENAKGATASAKMGYTFVEWQDANHKQVSTDPEFIPTNVMAPATYYAVFAKQKVKVEYTADVGGFITSPSGATFGSVIEQVTYGENAVGATASAKPGYYFVRWVDAEGNEVGTELHFAPENVTEEAVYKAVFAEQTAIEVKAENLRKEYDGTAIEANDKYATNTTLKYGHKLVVTTKVSKEVINVTDTAGKHQIESIRILDANDKDVTGQYQVSKADGSLTILPKPISIEVADGVKTYGETDPEITVTANGLVNGNDLGEITYERESESENAGVYTDDLRPVYTPNPNYTVTEMPGTLTINKRPIVLTSYGDTKTYDGEALTKPEVEIGDVKFVEGDAEVEASGTQTLVGESDNTIKITWKDDALAGNYNITKTEGKLIVTPPENLDEYVVKEHNGVDQNFKVGDTVTFKISVTNIYDAKATVTLEEMAGMTFENGQTTLEDVLDPGQTKTYTATRILTEQDFENGGVRNTVKVTLVPDGKDPIEGGDDDEVKLEEKPDMSVDKTVVNPQDSYRVGDTIRYQITVTNTGNVPLHDLELTDVMNADGKVTFPAGTALTRELLNIGETWTVTCSYVVRDADEGKTISNTAKVIARDDDGNPNKDGEDTTPGESVQKRYSLTIHYRNAAGNAVAGSYSARYHVGDSFKIVSPIVAGYYDPQIRSISSGANGMPAQDLEYVVTYMAIPVPAPDPGPAPNPGPDDGDDDDDTPPAPVEPEEPGDYEVDPDDYTLTEVEDNETPLANLNLEGHTCCILHLLLMLAAMVVLGFDTKSRKKHQARIFELKKMLAMEEDHSDDPEQP